MILSFLVFLFCGFVNKGLYNGVFRFILYSGMSSGRQYMFLYYGIFIGMRSMIGGYFNISLNSMLFGYLAGIFQGGMFFYSLIFYFFGQGGGVVFFNMCYSILFFFFFVFGLLVLQEMFRRLFNFSSSGVIVSVITVEFYFIVEIGRVLVQLIRKVKIERNCLVEIVYVKFDLINYCFIDFKFKMKVKKECEIIGFRIFWN